MKGKSVVLNFKQLEHGNKNAAYNAKLGEMKGKILGYYSFSQTETHIIHIHVQVMMVSFCFSSSKEVKNLKTKYAKQKDKFIKQRQYLCEVQKRSRQHYERIQKEVR